MMIDVYDLISEPLYIVNSASSFEYTFPLLKSDLLIKYMKTGTNNNTTNEQTQFCGSVKSTEIFISKYRIRDKPKPDEISAKFKGESEILTYYRITNPIFNGVNNANIPVEGNILISSGGLSGCTACSVFVPEDNKVLFFHVGHVCGQANYSQQNKNADLFNCIVLNLNDVNLAAVPNAISDDILFNKLVELISSQNKTLIIDVYISKVSSTQSSSNTWNTNMNYSNLASSVCIKYYEYKAEYLVSLCNGLYSVHNLKNRDMLYYSDYRLNYIY